MLWTSLGFLLTGAVLAMPRYRVQAIQQFHYDQDNPLWELDRRVMACTYCHTEANGGKGWNSFGEHLREQFRLSSQQKKKFPEVLYELLKAEKDSDGDGYSDVLEVYAKTLPGDNKSKPKLLLQELSAEYDKAGGIKQYKPRKKK